MARGLGSFWCFLLLKFLTKCVQRDLNLDSDTFTATLNGTKTKVLVVFEQQSTKGH